MFEIDDYIYSSNNTLGRGSFSTVYLGENIINQEKIAIKKISLEKYKSIAIDIQNEIKILQKLNHPNIVSLVHRAIKDNQLYIILEYCPLGDLHEFYKEKYVKEYYVCHYAKQIISGLKYLATMNIMHRDIKPHNILIIISNMLITRSVNLVIHFNILIILLTVLTTCSN